jgi:hypothetical protein
VPENELIRKLRKLAKTRGKNMEELLGELEDEKEEKRRVKYWSRELSDSPFINWEELLRKVSQEHEAKRLQREYETLRAIHDYSEKLEALQDHIEAEKLEASKCSESEPRSFQEETLEIEVEEGALQGINVLLDMDVPEGKIPKVESQSSQLGDRNFEMSPNFEFGSEISLGFEVGTSSGEGLVSLSSAGGSVNTGLSSGGKPSGSGSSGSSVSGSSGSSGGSGGGGSGGGSRSGG